MKTLIAIGDGKDWEAYLKFCKQRKLFRKSIRFKKISYYQLFSGKLPNTRSEEVIIFLFFPFNHWDKYIEPKTYRGTYGNYSFYTKFADFWKGVGCRINNFYYNKKIHYINHPDTLATDRDKKLTKEILAKAKIPVPGNIKTRKITEIRKLSKSRNLFIKVRCGAMGKGITYLTKDKWLTNFRFRNNRIFSRKSDYGWTFLDKTRNNGFLKELLKKDVIIEPEVKSFLIDGEKFDLRLYVSLGKVRYIYPRSNTKDAITTNISQGALGRDQDFLSKIPKHMLSYARKVSVKAVKALNLDFGGVDIIFNARTKKPIVLEINCFPGFPSPKRYNLSKELIHDIVKKYGN